MATRIKTSEKEPKIRKRALRSFQHMPGKDAMDIVDDIHERAELQVGQQRIAINDLLPKQPTGKPIIFIPGFYAEGDCLRQMMIDMFLAGRPALTYNSFHGADSNSSYFATFKEQYQTKIEQLEQWDPGVDITPQLRKAAVVIELAKQKKQEYGFQSFELFGHSEGAIVATIVKFLEPDLFGKTALLNPAGMVGERRIEDMQLNAAMDILATQLARPKYAVISGIRGTRNALFRVAPFLTVQPKHTQKLNYRRRVSPRYGEDREKDLITGKQMREVDFRFARRLLSELTLPIKMHREYTKDADKTLLKEELRSLTARRLERWLQHMNTADITIGASNHDQLYPARIVKQYSKKAEVKMITIKNATHNIHHYQPDKVSEFLYQALEVQKPTITGDNSKKTEGTTVDLAA